MKEFSIYSALRVWLKVSDFKCTGTVLNYFYSIDFVWFTVPLKIEILWSDDAKKVEGTCCKLTAMQVIS